MSLSPRGRDESIEIACALTFQALLGEHFAKGDSRYHCEWGDRGGTDRVRPGGGDGGWKRRAAKGNQFPSRFEKPKEVDWEQLGGKAHIQCFKCRKNGHAGRDCPNKQGRTPLVLVDPSRARLCIRIPTNGYWCLCIAWSKCPNKLVESIPENHCSHEKRLINIVY